MSVDHPILIGVADEYGTIWAGEPGASKRIGDLVQRDDDETFEVRLDEALADSNALTLIERIAMGDFSGFNGAVAAAQDFLTVRTARLADPNGCERP